MKHQDESEVSRNGEQARQPYCAPRLTDLGAIQSLVQLSGGSGPDSSVTDCTHTGS
jgi:hypothetical protein